MSNWTSLDELSLPIEVIKRIEIIKGPASRVFGQNAFRRCKYRYKVRLIMMLHYVFRRVLMASLVLLLPRELV
jgi:hypothetical protein